MILTAGQWVLCRVVDISPGGARLQAPGADHLPDTFTLEVTSEAVNRQVNVRWRKPDEVGVSFT
jgi:hypothetical protein